MSEHRLATPNPVRLELQLPIGELRIETIDGDESTVTLDGTSKLIDATKVDQSGDRVLVAMRRKKLGGIFGGFDGSLRLHARVPHHSEVTVVTAAGDASLNGTFSALALKSASGGLRASGEVEGTVSVKTVSGDASLPRVDGELNVRTVSGDVDAAAVGGSVSVRSVSGDVRIGSVRQGAVDVQSVSGDVDLGIAPGTSIAVDARSASGELSSEVPLSDKPDRGDGRTVIVRGNTASGDFRLYRAA